MKKMKHTINIEIEIDTFYPLYELDDSGDLADEMVYTEDDFVADIKRIIIDKLEDWDLVGDHFDTWPEEWEYLPSCAKKLTIKVNEKELTLGRYDSMKKEDERHKRIIANIKSQEKTI